VIAENLYRLIQESLNNVLKHARATHVAVSIRRVECGGQTVLSVRVMDDGVGAPGDLENGVSEGSRIDVPSRLGILGMKERVELLGGTFDLHSGINEGTSVEVSVPLPELPP
jgi:signal transduction histidine kinase